MIPAGVILGAGALSGLFSGLSGASAANKSAKEQAREYNISNAPGVARLKQGAGLRDRLLQAATARFGASPTTYTQAQGQYQPSADLAQQEELYKKLLAQMGYGPALPHGQWQNPTGEIFHSGSLLQNYGGGMGRKIA